MNFEAAKECRAKARRRISQTSPSNTSTPLHCTKTTEQSRFTDSSEATKLGTAPTRLLPRWTHPIEYSVPVPPRRTGTEEPALEPSRSGVLLSQP